jgi:hypothetical protein
MIRNIKKSIYQRTHVDATETLVFETEQAYIEWLKAHPTMVIHEVDSDDGLIIIKYTR